MEKVFKEQIEKGSQDGNDKLLEEMVRSAESAPEPGATRVGEVVHKGDEGQPAPMVISKVASAGYAYIYDTVTGERSLTNNNMLLSQLKKTRPDGSRVFSTMKPSVVPKRGQLKCLLHQDDPNREHYDEMGLGVCKKSNLINQFQVTQHMQRKHKVEWAAIQAEKKEAQEAQARASQEVLLKLAGQGVKK
jgi:hypothetical protein